jgi:hypothetical protein
MPALWMSQGCCSTSNVRKVRLDAMAARRKDMGLTIRGIHQMAGSLWQYIVLRWSSKMGMGTAEGFLFDEGLTCMLTLNR